MSFALSGPSSKAKRCGNDRLSLGLWAYPLILAASFAVATGGILAAQAPAPFKLGTFQRDARTFVGIVLRDSGIWERRADDTRWNPYLFLKATSAIIADGEAIRIPAGRTQIDWECELGVVIGRTASRVPAAEAASYNILTLRPGDIIATALPTESAQHAIRLSS